MESLILFLVLTSDICVDKSTFLFFLFAIRKILHASVVKKLKNLNIISSYCIIWIYIIWYFQFHHFFFLLRYSHLVIDVSWTNQINPCFLKLIWNCSSRKTTKRYSTLNILTYTNLLTARYSCWHVGQQQRLSIGGDL